MLAQGHSISISARQGLSGLTSLRSAMPRRGDSGVCTAVARKAAGQPSEESYRADSAVRGARRRSC